MAKNDWKSACKRDPPRRRIWTHLRHTISRCAGLSRGSFLCLFVLLDRLTEAVALAVHFEDVTVMGQPIQQSGRYRHPEDSNPSGVPTLNGIATASVRYQCTTHRCQRASG